MSSRTHPVALLTLLVAALAVTPGARAQDARPLLVTVDDLPVAGGPLHREAADRERITRGLLAVLAAHDIRAVGLVTWSNVRSPEDRRLLEMWLEAGHELGNHSTAHRSYTTTDVETYVADIEAARDGLAAFLEPRDRELRFFRFPMLREGDTEAKLEAMRAYLESSGQRNLPVTIDNQDWSFERPWVEAQRAGDEEAMARVAEAYHEALHVSVRYHERTGDRLFDRPLPQILLLHANAVGAAQWDRLFAWLEDSGHRFAPADEVLADPVFDTPHRYVGPRGFSLWDRFLSERRLAQARADIEALMESQEEAWNRGDHEAFVATYAEDAVFVTPSGVTNGRAAVLERYRTRYPDRATMGTLQLEVVDLRSVAGTEVSMLGDAAPGRVHGVSVVARWTLSYGEEREPASGLTVLVFMRSGDGWQVVHDASMAGGGRG